MMPNASNTDRVVEAIGGEDTTERAAPGRAGPAARARLGAIAPEAAAVDGSGSEASCGRAMRGGGYRLHR